jgi:hypothetical protein
LIGTAGDPEAAAFPNFSVERREHRYALPNDATKNRRPASQGQGADDGTSMLLSWAIGESFLELFRRSREGGGLAPMSASLWRGGNHVFCFMRAGSKE